MIEAVLHRQQRGTGSPCGIQGSAAALHKNSVALDDLPDEIPVIGYGWGGGRGTRWGS